MLSGPLAGCKRFSYDVREQDGRSTMGKWPRHVVDTPFALWLDERIGDRTLGRVEEDSGVGKGRLSDYLSKGKVPGLASLRKLAAYFGVELGELERLADPAPAAPAVGHGAVVERLEMLEVHVSRQMTEERLRAILDEYLLARAAGEEPEPAAAGDEAVPDTDWDAGASRSLPGLESVKVKGQGLAPVIPSGATVWVNPAMEPEAGRYVLVEHKGRRMFRRVGERGGKLVLLSRGRTDPLALADAVVVGVLQLVQHPL